MAGLRGHFSEPEILELMMMIGQYIGFGRMLAALQLEEAHCPI
jgi:alkylhydroperoxidase family enzyme